MSPEPDIPEDDDRILAAEYVLGLLTALDRRRFEARLDGEPDLRAQVAGWSEDFVSLTRDMPEVAPPPRVWAAIDAALDSGTAPARGWLARLLPDRRNGMGLLGYAIGGAVAAMLAWVVLNSGLMTPAAPEFLARIAAEDESLIFAAAFDVETQSLDLVHQAGHAPEGRSLEFWVIPDGGTPVSVMVWPTGSREESVRLPADLAARLPTAVLAISDEPQGGSPTGSPTGAVLALGHVQGI